MEDGQRQSEGSGEASVNARPPTIYYRPHGAQCGPHFRERRRGDKPPDPNKIRRDHLLAIIGEPPGGYAQAPYGFQLRRALDRAQGGLCGVCGLALVFGARARPKPTLEHVIPRARGGPGFGNVVRTHERCNNEKADRWPTGCELIFLMAVNARLEDEISLTADELDALKAAKRTAKRARQRKAQKARR